MKAAVIHAFGQLPHFEDFPEPTASAGEVGVTVRAAALHPVVRARASSSTSGSATILPQIPGIDGVGYLDDGTRVYFALARPPYGTMAERSVVHREMTFPLPDRLDDLTAAAVFNAEAASGTLRIETDPVTLAEIEAAWQRQTPDNRRLVVLP